MIQIGCNYSPELMQLLKSNKVTIDWIKLSKEDQFEDQFEAVNDLKPVLLHFIPRVLSRSFPKAWNLHTLNAAIKKCNSPHIALHMRANTFDLDLPMSGNDFLKAVVENIEEKKTQYHTKLLIENMPSTCLPKGYEALADPNFIKKVCDLCKIGLCLDMAHAEISAFYRHESLDDYIQKLPLEKIEEVHLSRSEKIEEDMIDQHEALSTIQYRQLEKVLEKACPKIVTLEYGGEGPDYQGKSDIMKIEDQLNRLSQILGQYK